MLALSLLSGVAGGILGFVQKFVKKKQEQKHDLEVLKLNQQHDINLLDKQVPIEQIKLSQAGEQTKQADEASYQAYLQFAQNTTTTNTSSAIVNFLNGATRPLITYLDRIVFLIVFFAVHKTLSASVLDELLFVVLDLIIFENAFWFGHKNSDRLFGAVNKMRNAGFKKKSK